MKLLLTGTPVSPSRVSDVFEAYGVQAVAASRCSAVATPRWEVPSAGLAGTRVSTVAPSTGGVTGHVWSQGGRRPAGMPQRKRNQHIDLDPQRPRPSGGCG
ncbi:hypothetical protein LQ327_13700 [Actinomycetospora endophytica]|uniref:Uncharacterized protein n=1 Tax=Actinomycetospora endophytica TaxID=2291215 RepID=A0ABS8P8T7_9PSEU|nr:hypothetical protein [Actinomycetospora endophytica]MCD2194428.1 hypothetical protein [Actinomycetospora endophytica]